MLKYVVMNITNTQKWDIDSLFLRRGDLGSPAVFDRPKALPFLERLSVRKLIKERIIIIQIYANSIFL